MANLAIAAGACNLVGGQEDDLKAEFSDLGIEQLERIHRRKTGAMIRVSLRLGGIVAGASDAQLAALDTYGEKLGLAFQIVDDLLDLEGDETSLGKRDRQGRRPRQAYVSCRSRRRREPPSGRADLIDEAIAALAPFWSRSASPLESLARYVLERDRCAETRSMHTMTKHPLLSRIESAHDLHGMSVAQLSQLAGEIRDVLCNLLEERTAHFASNLGVVELALALHSVFDFRRDRLIWDTGHQIYPHKLITGRYAEFQSIRTKGGLMGYPNPDESEYDLFMTGHAGSSIATLSGLRSGDDLLGDDKRRAVAVIGDGAFPSGIVFEALNNISGLKQNVLIVLNDNKMSICPRVGGVASYLDRLRTSPFYSGLKQEVVRILDNVPLLGDPVERFLAQLKEGVKAGLHGGMLFEELGLRYLGPIDGHNIPLLRKYLNMVKDLKGPILLHVVTEKGHGFTPAAQDPVFFHTPPAFTQENGSPVPKKSGCPAGLYEPGQRGHFRRRCAETRASPC